MQPNKKQEKLTPRNILQVPHTQTTKRENFFHGKEQVFRRVRAKILSRQKFGSNAWE